MKPMKSTLKFNSIYTEQVSSILFITCLGLHKCNMINSKVFLSTSFLHKQLHQALQKLSSRLLRKTRNTLRGFYEFVKMLLEKIVTRDLVCYIPCTYPCQCAFITAMLECDPFGERFHEQMEATSMSLMDKTFPNLCLKLTIQLIQDQTVSTRINRQYQSKRLVP